MYNQYTRVLSRACPIPKEQKVQLNTQMVFNAKNFVE